MSAGTATLWSLDAGLPDWLVVPVGPGTLPTWRDDVTRVLSAITDVDEQLRSDPDCLAPGAPLDIDEALDSLLETAASLPVGQRLVAGLTIPGRWPLPVIVNVTRTEDDPPDLLEAAGGRGGIIAMQGAVDDLPEDLGDRIRVTRFDLDDDGVLRATVSCASRDSGADTVLTWRTSDLDLVPLFSPQLEGLLGLIRIGASA